MSAVILGALDIAALPAEVAPARHWLCKLLCNDHKEIIDDVVLMACEAITNSVRHSDSAVRDADGAPGTVTVLVMADAGALRIEVIDAGSPTNAPRFAEDGPDSVNGRGLHLIDLLSGGRWGSYTHDDGRTVWFEMGP
ncbi:ATP-binding protein [Actinomadura sp. DC4]|uniref:ATP-binding protein n=1 Tax=Actinomadura sp. DC4 TaxID=3055069 RepID=UPI0025B148E6|nr:ATP-binding protein [Actinomadura sp. DC4]MDN3354596.1 ATP-binding protein [Actinomadura sp. DC4]